MFIGVPENIKSFIKDVSPNHWRVQAVIIESLSSRTLLINTYFPFDKREGENEAGEDDELTETLEVIQIVLETNVCDAVVWTGDINSDFKRNTKHTRTVREAVEDSNLLVTWDKFSVDFTCSLEREGATFSSILDHFFMSEQLAINVTDAGVLHHHDNSSDHEPIYCVFKSITLGSTSSQAAAPKPKPSWKKASSEEKEKYEYSLNRRMAAIMVPTQISECKDLHCREKEHLEAVDWFTAEVLEAVQEAGEETLPYPRAGGPEDKSTRKVTPGFNEHVKPFKEKAYFWHQVWKSAGCPQNTELHRIMKRTKNIYHVEYKKCEKAEQQIKKSKLLDACLNGNGELF